MTRLFLIISLLLWTGDLLGQESKRLTFSDKQLDDLGCAVVESYFEYKKYTGVIVNRTETETVRNSNSIALFRLLHPRFTIDEREGNRDGFITSLKDKSNDYGLLKRSYENFDCPLVKRTPEATPVTRDIVTELTKMNIELESGEDILTNRYRGSMLFQQIDLSSYNISSTVISKETKGIDKAPQIMELQYEAYPLSDDEYVLKIRRIQDVTGKQIVKMIHRNKKDSTLVLGSAKPRIKNFRPCCPQPNPDDNDGDGYSILVEPYTDNDNTIYPGAPEIIGDGIDQDLDGFDQLGDDQDEDGYFLSACNSPDPIVRLKCDCNDRDREIYFRPQGTPEVEWYNPTNGWNDDNCDCEKDRVLPFNWVPLKRSDYFILGLGHLKRGRSKTYRKMFGYGYPAIIGGSASYALYHKFKSDGHYRRHQSAETFRISDIEFSEANEAHKHFVVATSVATVTFIVQYFHLRRKEKRQRSYHQEIFEDEKQKLLDSRALCTWELGPSSSSLGLGLYINLN